MKLRNLITRAVWLAALLLASPVIASSTADAADSSVWLKHDFVQTRIIAATEGMSQSGEITLGLQVRLAPGWDTYWRTPGDSGLPTQLDWSESVNFAGSRTEWPLPKRLKAYGQETFVYETEVVIPVHVVADNPKLPLQINLKVDYGVCKEICIPMTDRHALLLFPSKTEPGKTEFAPTIASFVGKVPTREVTEELAIEQLVLMPHGDRTILEIQVNALEPLLNPDAFVEVRLPYIFGVPVVLLKQNGRSAVLHLAIFGGEPEALAGQQATVTLFDDSGRAIESTLVIKGGPGSLKADRPPTD